LISYFQRFVVANDAVVVVSHATRALDMTEMARPTRGTARGATRMIPPTRARAENRALAAAAAAV
jgi:hypothetical protein